MILPIPKGVFKVDVNSIRKLEFGCKYVHLTPFIIIATLE